MAQWEESNRQLSPTTAPTIVFNPVPETSRPGLRRVRINIDIFLSENQLRELLEFAGAGRETFLEPMD